MRKIFFGPLVFVFMFQALIFASQNNDTDKYALTKKEVSGFDLYKNVLYKLIKQDELLDEAIEKSKTAKLDQEYVKYIRDVSATITKNLNEVTDLNKTQLAHVSTGPQITRYTRSIMSYTNRIDRKIRVLSASIEKRYSVAGYRNAPLSSGNNTNGKRLSQILQEQEKVKSLKKNLNSLKYASGRARACGRWLYIASK